MIYFYFKLLSQSILCSLVDLFKAALINMFIFGLNDVVKGVVARSDKWTQTPFRSGLWRILVPSSSMCCLVMRVFLLIMFSYAHLYAKKL